MRTRGGLLHLAFYLPGNQFPFKPASGHMTARHPN